MKSSYKKLGQYIKVLKFRNLENMNYKLKGINIDKFFMPSVANIVGTDLSKYKIVTYNQFACNRMHVGRDKRLPVAISKEKENIIVSPAYDVFEIIDENILSPDYLMMWFSRIEFDRNAWFHTDGDVRGGLPWGAFSGLELPVPNIEKQREIVKEYNTIVDRIKLNEELNKKLEETAQSIYKHWFVDFEFPISKEYAKEIGKPELEGKPYKSSGGKMVYNDEFDQEIPNGWKKGELIDLAEITMGQSPSGESYNENSKGEIFYQGRTEFGFRFPNIKTYTTEPKRRAIKGDILMSVRAPVGDLNIANNNCCIGRGIASLRSRLRCNTHLYYLMNDVRNQFNISNDEGTIFGSITKDALYEIIVIKPIDNEINKFEVIVSKIDLSIYNYCKQINSLMSCKDILLSKITNMVK
ncbi:MAG: restriction endonuclease subunit S [bacterium]|nr:restriction endonuclease subunit S [bacterium]